VLAFKLQSFTVIFFFVERQEERLKTNNRDLSMASAVFTYVKLIHSHIKAFCESVVM